MTRVEQDIALREAAEALLAHYVEIVESGDCGFWNPETEPVVVALRAALSRVPSSVAASGEKS